MLWFIFINIPYTSMYVKKKCFLLKLFCFRVKLFIVFGQYSIVNTKQLAGLYLHTIIE